MIDLLLPILYTMDYFNKKKESRMIPFFLTDEVINIKMIHPDLTNCFPIARNYDG